MTPPDDAPDVDVLEIADEDDDELDEMQPLDGATCTRHVRLKLRPWWSLLLRVPGMFVSQWRKHGLLVAWLSVRTAVQLRWLAR